MSYSCHSRCLNILTCSSIQVSILQLQQISQSYVIAETNIGSKFLLAFFFFFNLIEGSNSRRYKRFILKIPAILNDDQSMNAYAYLSAVKIYIVFVVDLK